MDKISIIFLTMLCLDYTPSWVNDWGEVVKLCGESRKSYLWLCSNVFLVEEEKRDLYPALYWKKPYFYLLVLSFALQSKYSNKGFVNVNTTRMWMETHFQKLLTLPEWKWELPNMTGLLLSNRWIGECQIHQSSGVKGEVNANKVIRRVGYHNIHHVFQNFLWEGTVTHNKGDVLYYLMIH